MSDAPNEFPDPDVDMFTGTVADVGHAKQQLKAPSSPDTAPEYRILRVLEYTGTAQFISDSINRRSVKGHVQTKSGTIREAIIGETAEMINYSQSNFPTMTQSAEDSKDAIRHLLSWIESHCPPQHYNAALSSLQELYAEQMERDINGE